MKAIWVGRARKALQKKKPFFNSFLFTNNVVEVLSPSLHESLVGGGVIDHDVDVCVSPPVWVGDALAVGLAHG